MLLPFMEALRHFYPGAEFWVLAEPRNVQAFSLLSFPCRTLNYTSPSDFFTLFRMDFHVVVDTEQWYGLSALVARLVQAHFRVGFGTNVRAGCFNRAVGYCQKEYEAQAFFRLLEPWGREFFWWDWIPPGLTSVRRSEGSWAAIFPGASHPSRRWGETRYLEVARYLVDKGWGIVMVGGPKERREGEFIASRLPSSRVRNATGSVDLKETMRNLAACRFLVTTDSSIMHLAALMGIPTLSLFGPGIVEKWAPRGEDHLVVRLDLPCSPCTRFGTVPPCPRQFACMRNLTPEMVVEALEGFLERLAS